MLLKQPPVEMKKQKSFERTKENHDFDRTRGTKKKQKNVFLSIYSFYL
jgi:hypothetical protein